tara:strand:- start:51 stop:512 length:462 start_codon:yes stop_codon:yes gene_type:complete
MSINEELRPENIEIIHYRIESGSLNNPDGFDDATVTAFVSDSALELGFIPIEQIVRCDFKVKLKTNSEQLKTEEATAGFHIYFIFKIKNFNELVQVNEENNNLKVHPWLSQSVASMTYSTCRGILLTRLQGTAFANFYLPAIAPATLLESNQK